MGMADRLVEGGLCVLVHDPQGAGAQRREGEAGAPLPVWDRPKDVRLTTKVSSSDKDRSPLSQRQMTKPRTLQSADAVILPCLARSRNLIRRTREEDSGHVPNPKANSAGSSNGGMTIPHELVQVDRIRPNVPPRPVVLLRPAGPLPTMITTPPRRARGLGER